MLGDRIADLQLRAEAIDNETKIRMEYTKEAFVVCKRNLQDYYSDHWKIPFSSRVASFTGYSEYWVRQLGPDRLQDMKHEYPEILRSLESLMSNAKEYFDGVHRFYARASQLIAQHAEQVDENMLKDETWISSKVRVLFVSILGKIRSSADVDKLGFFTDDQAKEIRFVLDSNVVGPIVLEILKDEKLNEMAWVVEGSRLESNMIFSNVSRAINYLFQEPKSGEI